MTATTSAAIESNVAPGNTVQTYGLLTIAGIELALPLSALREVVPCPEFFSPLPAVAKGLVGAIELRRHIVPVVDIRQHLGIDDTEKADVVIIITDGTHLVGLLANSLGSVTQLPSDDLMGVQSALGPLFFSHTFRCDEVGGGIVSVLDVQQIIGIPGLPLVSDSMLSADGPATRLSADVSEKYTLLRCGPYALALDIERIFTTLPMVDLLPSVIDSDLCKGVTSYSGRHVPVVDPLALLGLGRLQEHEVGAGVVLKLNEGFVILAVTELVDIVDIPVGSLLSLPQFSFRRPEFFKGATSVPAAEQVLVLDGERLLRERDLLTYADLNTNDGTTSMGDADPLLSLAANSGEVATPSGEAQLVYSIGFELVTPLEQIAEILPVPDSVIDTPGADHLLGSMLHRERVVPIIDLAVLVGRSSEPSAVGCLLLVAFEGELVAFAIQALRSIDPLTWRDPDATALTGTSGDLIANSPVVQVRGENTLLPQLDLQQLAGQLRN
jgi:purine-binding chemotaxis protein CheW